MMKKPGVLVTYVSHHGKNGLPFRCCAECSDPYAVLDWLKQRELSGLTTMIVAWHYTSSLRYLPGRVPL